MKMWQRSQARANKLEQQLTQFVRSGGGTPAPQSPQGLPAEVRAWVQAVRESEIDRIYQSDPRFEAYGFQRGDLAGETPAEIKASADRFRQLIERVEGAARNSLQRELGVVPDIVPERRGPRKDFASMSSEEFEKEIARAKGWS